MARESEIIKRLVSTLDDSVNKFNTSIPGIQRDIAKEIELFVKDLDISGDTIKANVANMRKIATFQSKIMKIIRNSDYPQQVKDFVKSFTEVANIQNQYFSAIATDFKPTALLNEIKAQSVSATIDSLTESGLNSNFVNPIKEILRINGTSGGSYSKMVTALRDAVTTTTVKSSETATVDYYKYQSKVNTQEGLMKDLMGKLRDVGFKVPAGFATSNTNYGKSMYLIVEDSKGESYKFRVSDHSFESTQRMKTEYDVTNEGIGKKIVEAEKKAFPDRFKEVSKTVKLTNTVSNVSETNLQPEDKIINERISNSGKKVYEVVRVKSVTTNVLERKTNEVSNSKDGLLERYAKTTTTDSLNTFSRQYASAITNDLGLEWHVYIGAIIDTSRPWCIACHEKKYIHVSEFSDLLKGDFPEFKQADGQIYDKTGLPTGMKANTNVDNLPTLAGGWGCNHGMQAVSEISVPMLVRIKTYTEQGIPFDQTTGLKK